ncbi:MAG: PASTA domain-containing protein [Erysipelotrichaceae bacterium]|nr:PASTA domain-containing protein [Erysipelotrichaceae bacterium]
MKRIRYGIMYCAACTAAVFAGAFGGTQYYAVTHPAEVISFEGKNVTIAKDWANKNRVSEQVDFIYEYDEEADENTIMSQSLEEGTVMGRYEILSLTVSLGADPEKEFRIIDFTGKKEEEVRAWFDEHGFRNVTYEYRHTDDEAFTEGMFMEVVPAAGSTVKRSEKINVTIATKKSEDIIVSDLTLYTFDNLSAWADENRLTLNVTWVFDSSPYGTVISFDPEAGSIVHTGDSINVTFKKV